MIQKKVSVVLRLRNPAVTDRHHFIDSLPVLDSPSLSERMCASKWLVWWVDIDFHPRVIQALCGMLC